MAFQIVEVDGGQLYLVDKDTGTALKINSTGSIDTEIIDNSVTGGNKLSINSDGTIKLPDGATKESTLLNIKSKTDNIPTSPSQEHITAVSPNASRLSDGSAFYKATTPSDTQPISATTLPLPTNASQETGGNLATIKTNTDKLDINLSTRATESTLTSIKNTIDDGIEIIDNSVTGGNKLSINDFGAIKVVPTDINGNLADPTKTKIMDSLGVNLLKVNSDGSLNVNTATPSPPNTIPVNAIVQNSVGGSALTDTPWIVPVNTTFYLQKFGYGSDAVSGDLHRFFLYYNSYGTTIVANSILEALAYMNGVVSSGITDIIETIIGLGTNSFVMRRQRINSTARQLYSVVSGYLTYKTITVNETNSSTGITATTLTRTGAGWTVNAYTGKYLRLSNGTPYYIASNTTDTLTITGNLDFPSGVGTAFPYTINTFNA